MIYLVTGKKNVGKTTWLRKKFVELENASGFCSEKIHDCGRVTAYELSNLKTGDKKTVARLMSLPTPSDWGEDIQHGPFRFDSNSFVWAMEVLEKAKADAATSFIIDELGKLEISGKGLNDVVLEALKTDMDIYIGIRDQNIDDAVKAFSINNYEVINAVE